MRNPRSRCLFLLGLALAGCQVRETPAPVPSGTPGQPAAAPAGAPPLPAGQVVLLEVGATWDPATRAAQPVTEQLARDFTAQRLVVQRWMLGDPAETAHWPPSTLAPVMVTTEQVARVAAVRALPSRVLVDRRGQVRGVFPGPAEPAGLRDQLTAALQESAP